MGRVARLVGHTEAMLERVEAFIREQDLIEPGGEVTCLVSGGADSTCLWHVLGALGYRVSALHVAHGLRGAESDEDARFCREALGAEVVAVLEPQSPTEAELRELRYSVATDRLRATGHTASDQVESVLLGLVASGSPQRIKAKREDGVVRPLLGALARGDPGLLRRARAAATARTRPIPGPKRGLIRDEILPLLERLDPRARASLLALADERPRLPRTLERTLAELLAGRDGTKSADLGGGVRAVREYDTLRLEGTVQLGAVDARVGAARSSRSAAAARGIGSQAARKKVQDLLVDAKVPRAERDGWPLVVLRRRGRRRARRRGGAGLGRSGDVETVKDAVGEILIEEDALQARIAELGQEISQGVRGPRPAARRRAQGRRLLHGRPDARADRPVRDRLHGDLELRRGDRLVRASSGSSRTWTSTSPAATCSSSRTSSTRA